MLNNILASLILKITCMHKSLLQIECLIQKPSYVQHLFSKWMLQPLHSYINTFVLPYVQLSDNMIWGP